MNKLLEFTLVSDLHLDFGAEGPKLPGGELLVIAGDLSESRSLTFNDQLTVVERAKREGIQGWLTEQSHNYKKVLMVLGNHEHYHSTFHKTLDVVRGHLPENFQVLNNDTVEVNGVLFIGTTLWTDCNKADPLTLHALRDLMNDFRAIKYKNGEQYSRFLPNHAFSEHRKALDYIKAVLGNPGNVGKPVVVVSHHAPSTLSIAPQYQRDRIANGGWASDLSEFILDHPQIHTWCHGHVHHAFDYMIGPTRIVCNPWGYHEKCKSGVFAEQTGFDGDKVFEVELAAVAK